MDFRSVIARLEQQGKVVHVKSEVDRSCEKRSGSGT